ncbi:SacI homology domain-containing protein [Phellopilus nigrolimitatus]|nr:SacI homology domain-containing protein [Phellopilus nigrolimitatus]
MAPNPAYKRYNLYTTNSSYTFIPADGGDRTLIVHRTSGEIQVGSKFQTPVNNLDLRSSDIFGIIGIISLAITDYIVVMTGREYKGELLGHEIFRATKFQMLPMNPDIEPELYPAEHYLMGLLKRHLDDGLFWFSYTWDLTRRLQAQWSESGDGKSLWEVADDRFFWNKFLQSRFIDAAVADPEQKIGPFILPLVFGTFDIRRSVIKGYTMQLCLVSRRSRHRAGTRYFRRGIDHNGHVANFNETEQILLVDRAGKATGDLGARLSFVQIRGSIPLYWAEVNNLRYKPELQVMELPDSENAMRAHLQELVRIYGEQDLVNLVNHKGHELPMKEAYAKYVAKLNLPKVRYEYFDFHTECKNMRWDRISLLIGSIEEDLLRNGYFYEDADRPEVVKLQLGVVRTNCMDNLDRTNVAQSAFAKWMLNRQLRDIGVFQEHESVDAHEEFMHDFRNMWADHADYISKAYSGTGALKTDYTRTGKRSWMGYAQDGLNSVMRYLRNNYFDGPRQDGFDLFTGNWTPRPNTSGASSLWMDTRPLLIRSMPPLASLALFMICAGLTLPRTSDYSLTYWFLLWMSLLALALAFIFAHGVSYVSWPRLNPLTDVIEYNGPGFKGKRKGRGLGLSFLALANGAKNTGIMRKGSTGGTKQKWNAPQEIELGTLKKRVD